MREITIIAAKPKDIAARVRVAAYCRVSSGKDAMLHSLSAQVSYYNNYIGQRMDWEFAGIYADEALTGTKQMRPEFQRMLEDCRMGRIDMVVTKSITRFARNTVTLLEVSRELKLLGIDVFFEKEGIHTLSSDGEFMLTLLASYAQEESRSASENCKWRIKKMFEQGRPNTGNMLGYRLFDGKLYIIPEEAEIVRQIFADYLSGMGRNAIMKKLLKNGVPSKYGGKWRESTIHKILRNEKLIGDLCLQKTYVLDHISKKTVINRGEKLMYYVENSHEPIIDRATFDAVQMEIERRSRKFQLKPQPKKQYPFTGVLKCGLCGKHYQRRIAAAGSKYEKAVWMCATFDFYGKDECPSQQIPEDILTAKTAEALGLKELDEVMLKQQISEIQVPKPGQLVFVFKDGHLAIVEWENPSRKGSWTEEMKQAARERQLENIKRRRENGCSK